MGKISVLIVAAALLLGACSKGENPAVSGSESPGAGSGESPKAAGSADDHIKEAGKCSPSGAALTVNAKDIKFDKECLAAPAGAAFTIAFNNQEAVPHNVVISDSHDSKTPKFDGEVITGPKETTYNVPALAAGAYHFHCKIHPDQMNGDFVVK